ncbi:EamA family transporter [Rhodobacterales bacterium HKCCE3408]|nr:EamA family transporter [Rhodobacterales bacterium HKCCE3408]
MSATVFAVVLLAAALHALWNAVVKGGTDKAGAMTAVVIGSGIAGALLLPFGQLPAPESWPYILTGLALHLGYQFFLLQAYRFGDLTQVYPIARGIAPLLVAGGSALWLGTRLSGTELLAVAMISTGIASISLVRKGDGTFQGKAALLAAITGLFIASYSLVDGQGARLAGTALGYYGVLTALNALTFAITIRFTRPGLLTRGLKMPKSLVIGGGASFLAYLLVVWAFTQAPIPLVTALRETSIIFALLIGVFVLNERLNLGKIVATAVTLGGAVLLRLAPG